MNSDTIGARLRDERKRLGLSQDEMCVIGGVARTTQLKYEANKSKPDADYLQRLAEKGMDVLYVLRGIRVETMGGSRLYTGPGEALEVVLAAQHDLGITFSPDQLKTLLEYTYRHHVDEQGVKEFVRAAYAVTGNPLDGNDGKGESNE